ncbi:hypothetical protein D8S78_10400 [Natrialba swarupiae]|nr:hypothetical protein [Natrialba swarupiae]
MSDTEDRRESEQRVKPAIDAFDPGVRSPRDESISPFDSIIVGDFVPSPIRFRPTCWTGTSRTNVGTARNVRVARTKMSDSTRFNVCYSSHCKSLHT